MWQEGKSTGDTTVFHHGNDPPVEQREAPGIVLQGLFWGISVFVMGR